MPQPFCARVRVLDPDDVRRAMTRITHEILERNHGGNDVILVGLHTRGVPLAHRIAKTAAAVEGVDLAVGEIDIAFYRDDISIRPRNPTGPTEVPEAVDGATIVLVDDVLATGRSVRAAIDALLDFGRPRAVQLAVLVDRGHREFPIRPDYVGKNIPTAASDVVKVRLEEIDGSDGVDIGDRVGDPAGVLP